MLPDSQALLHDLVKNMAAEPRNFKGSFFNWNKLRISKIRFTLYILLRFETFKVNCAIIDQLNEKFMKNESTFNVDINHLADLVKK